ncbi:MAG TPA: YfiR family protein [Candidatus Eisenbacteria bacterium]|nr:YfiR family protein [Candidatus Eisenbacteria bacterium]
MTHLRLWRRLVPAALLTWYAVPALGAPADEPSALERRVKAAFLYKFAAYVTWPTPPASGSSFSIGVLGDDALAAELGRVVAGRTVEGRPVTVYRVSETDSLGNLHMLFVGRSRTSQLEAIAAAAREHSILTVSEAEGALSMGSVINFVLSSGKVRFEISLGAARKSGLALSSRLLGVALSVVDHRTNGGP